MASQINSLEWYNLLIHFKGPEEKFAHFDVMGSNPYLMRLQNGLEYELNDDIPHTNRQRPLEELIELGRANSSAD